MAQYGAVSQFLALVQWRARAHACVTTALTELRLLRVTEWLQAPCPDSWLPWPGLLTDWLWTLPLKAGHYSVVNLGCSCKTLTLSPLPVWCFNLNLTLWSFKLQRQLEQPLPADSSLAQPQQVHARDQVRRRSAGHPSPARGRWRGRRRWSGWKLAPPTRPIPPRRWHDIGEHIMKSVISHGFDIMIYWYQSTLSRLICSDVMRNIMIYWYQRRYCMICIWYRRQYHEKIAQERLKSIWYCQNWYDIMKKVWYHIWYHTFCIWYQ